MDDPARQHPFARKGQGMVMSGAELGFLSADAAPKWTARLMDAAGIEWEHVDVSSSLEVELEADDIGSEESSDGSEG